MSIANSKKVIDQLRTKGYAENQIEEYLRQKGMSTIAEVEKALEQSNLTEVNQEEGNQIDVDTEIPTEENVEQIETEPVREGEHTGMDKASNNFMYVVSRINESNGNELIDTFVEKDRMDMVIEKVLYDKGYRVHEFTNIQGEDGYLIRKIEYSDKSMKDLVSEFNSIALKI